MTVVVFGSINMDLVVRAPQIPAPGQTLSGSGFFTAPGGKGANQAVAAARLGATVRMVGRVGNDAFGPVLLAGLADDRVDAGGVLADAAHPSGVALITVDDRAENTIVVVAGANGAIGEPDLTRLDAALDGAQVLLLQLEIPLPMVQSAAELARRRGVMVVLDPAPARDLPPALYRTIDLITPNEHEAAALVGFPIDTPEAAEQAVVALCQRGVGQAIIKRGGAGACWGDAHRQQQIAPFPVKPVDTVAAGDAFNGGLATALAAGLPLAEALRWGMAAGALAVTKAGAQPSLPAREALLALLDA